LSCDPSILKSGCSVYWAIHHLHPQNTDSESLPFLQKQRFTLQPWIAFVHLPNFILQKNKECNNMGTTGFVSPVKYIYQLKEMMII